MNEMPTFLRISKKPSTDQPSLPTITVTPDSNGFFGTLLASVSTLLQANVPPKNKNPSQRLAAAGDSFSTTQTWRNAGNPKIWMIRTTIRIYDVHHFHSEDINNLRIFQHTVGTPAQPTVYDSEFFTFLLFWGCLASKIPMLLGFGVLERKILTHTGWPFGRWACNRCIQGHMYYIQLYNMLNVSFKYIHGPWYICRY